MTQMSHQSRPKILQFVAAAFFLVGVGGFIWLHRGELESLTHALRSGRWPWLLIAVGVEALYFLNEAFYFSRALRLTGTRTPAPALVPVLLGAQTLSVVVPSEFLADQSLFFLLAKRRGQSQAQVALGVSLAEVAELFSFMAVLIAGFLSLVVYHAVRPFEVAAGYVVLLLCLALGGAAAFLLWKPCGITGLLTRVQDLWNILCRITGRPWRLEPGWAERLSRRLIESITIARRDPRGLAVLLLLALVGHFVRIACLSAVFQAFGLPVVPWKVVAAYSIGTLAWVASPVPGGIGLVEGAYSLVFVSLGVAPAPALTLALAYRGITFWLPLGAGIIAIRSSSRRQNVLRA